MENVCPKTQNLESRLVKLKEETKTQQESTSTQYVLIKSLR